LPILSSSTATRKCLGLRCWKSRNRYCSVILDTGMPLQYLLRLFQQRKPKHLRVAVLLDKPERRIAAVRADYVGFTIPNEFVVGYGLDYSERYRNLPYVGILKLGSGAKPQK